MPRHSESAMDFDKVWVGAIPTAMSETEFAHAITALGVSSWTGLWYSAKPNVSSRCAVITFEEEASASGAIRLLHGASLPGVHGASQAIIANYAQNNIGRGFGGRGPSAPRAVREHQSSQSVPAMPVARFPVPPNHPPPGYVRSGPPPPATCSRGVPSVAQPRRVPATYPLPPPPRCSDNNSSTNASSSSSSSADGGVTASEHKAVHEKLNAALLALRQQTQQTSSLRDEQLRNMQVAATKALDAAEEEEKRQHQQQLHQQQKVIEMQRVFDAQQQHNALHQRMYLEQQQKQQEVFLQQQQQQQQLLQHRAQQQERKRAQQVAFAQHMFRQAAKAAQAVDNAAAAKAAAKAVDDAAKAAKASDAVPKEKSMPVTPPWETMKRRRKAAQTDSAPWHKDDSQTRAVGPGANYKEHAEAAQKVLTDVKDELAATQQFLMEEFEVKREQFPVQEDNDAPMPGPSQKPLPMANQVDEQSLPAVNATKKKKKEAGAADYRPLSGR